MESAIYYLVAGLTVAGLGALIVWLVKKRLPESKVEFPQRTDSVHQAERPEKADSDRQQRPSEEATNEQNGSHLKEGLLVESSIGQGEPVPENGEATTSAQQGSDALESGTSQGAEPPVSAPRPERVNGLTTESEPGGFQTLPGSDASFHGQQTAETGLATALDVQPESKPAVVKPDLEAKVEPTIPVSFPGSSPIPISVQPSQLENAEVTSVLGGATESPKSAEQETVQCGATAQKETEEGRRAGDYRPPRVRALKRKELERTEAEGVMQTARERRAQPLESRIQANPNRNGFCNFRLLVEKPNLFLPELTVKRGHHRIVLVEAGDDWYEAQIDLKELSGWLTEGIILHHQGENTQRTEWQLSRREVFVLAGQPGFGGLVSTTRLDIGRRHLVLCKAGIASEVDSVLHEAGCPAVRQSTEEQGAPSGWVFFWPVEPTRPLPQLNGDILDILRPQPDIEILLEGGLWMRDSTWLADYPPQIRIVGVLPAEENVYIDGTPAQSGEDGCYAVDGYDRLGLHQIICGGKSASYSISEAKEGWESWKPHRFRKGFICGASVTLLGSPSQQPVTVPGANRLLVGAHPGEVFVCPLVSGKQWTGFVPFRVVWALPLVPLHCDGPSNRVVLLRALPSSAEKAHLPRKPALQNHVWCWSQTIRECSQKRLAIEPADEQTVTLWRAYVANAKRVQRRLRK